MCIRYIRKEDYNIMEDVGVEEERSSTFVVWNDDARVDACIDEERRLLLIVDFEFMRTDQIISLKMCYFWHMYCPLIFGIIISLCIVTVTLCFSAHFALTL